MSDFTDPEVSWTRLKFAGRAAIVLLLLWWTWHFLTVRIIDLGFESGFMHRVHLVFHEAGHILLMWAPRVIVALGGTIGQTAVPLALMVAFVLRKNQWFAAAVCLWWFGQSLVDVAPYINDARMLQLPLLGVGTGAQYEGHDWEYILTHWKLLEKDIYIARVVLAVGRTVMVGALLWSIAVLGFQAADIVRLWRIERDNRPPEEK